MLGGTFDPIHVGHLVAAVNSRHALHLDRVILVVANIPWQKSGRSGYAVSAAEDRYAMVAAAVADVDGLEASRIEVDRGGESYTADTLAALAAAYPTDELFLIIGADVAAELASWRRIEEVQHLATLVVVGRPGAPDPEIPPGWQVERVEVPQLEISSTDLRARVVDGRPLDWLVPPAAVRCIRERGLYAVG